MKRLLPLTGLLLAAATATAAEPAVSGKDVFAYHCGHCHGPGHERPGTFQLSLTRGADRGLLEERTDLTADYVRHIVRHGLKAMPAFVPSQITDDQLDALTDYLTR